MKNETDVLMERIILLEDRQAQELSLLREQLYSTYESLKPLNLIKNTLSNVASSQSLKDHILNGAIGLSVGYLSKKVLIGSTHNPIKNLAGTILQFAIANIVAKHSNTIRAKGEVFFRSIFEKKDDLSHEVEMLEDEINMLVVNQVKTLHF